MKSFLNVVLKLVNTILDDVLLLAGVGFISYGTFLIYLPAGFIVLGLCLLVMAYLVAKRPGK